jgi:hypothetical protein
MSISSRIISNHKELQKEIRSPSKIKIAKSKLPRKRLKKPGKLLPILLASLN